MLAAVRWEISFCGQRHNVREPFCIKLDVYDFTRVGDLNILSILWLTVRFELDYI